jgi:hypothetical protein
VKGEHRLFLPGHQRRKSPLEYVVEDHGHETPCWIWQRGMAADGRAGPVYGEGGRDYAYRHYYREYVGPIPPKHEVHHICQQPACVNPSHLEALTSAEHKARHREPAAA